MPNEQQAEHWNGGESVHYVDNADRYDQQLDPFTEIMLERAGIRPHESVLDIGCGCGAATSRAAAVARRAVGADISEPLVEVASRRAGAAGLDHAEFVVADVQTHPFPVGEFDVVISQFGVMFFDDPVGAFSNIRAAMRPGGRFVAICWRGLPHNEWLMVLGREVQAHVELPDFGGLVGGPGMFALKDGDESLDLLESAGFDRVEVEAVSPDIVLAGGASLDESIDFLFGMGMAKGLLGLVGPEVRDDVVERTRRTLAERYQPGVGVRLGAGAWAISARNPG